MSKIQLPEILIQELGVVGTDSVAHWRDFRPVVNLEKCRKCWLCVVYCPEGVILQSPVGPKIDYEFCKGCGVCANECPVKAIEMVREE